MAMTTQSMKGKPKPDQEIAKQPTKKQELATTVRKWLESDQFRIAIQKAAPKHADAERMIQAAMTATKINPKLLECEVTSFLNCVMQLSQYGLRLDGREAHLIPFKTTCTLIVDYKGYVKMAYQSGMVKNIEAGVVYDGDEFDYSTCHHTPWHWLPERDKTPDRGKIKGAFAIVEMVNGGIHRERLTDIEVNGIRARSKAGRDGPWVTDFDEMAKKSAFRRATKWIPISDELSDVMAKDDDRFETLDAVVRPTPSAKGLTGLESRLTEKAAEESSSEGMSEPLETEGEPTTTVEDKPPVKETPWQKMPRRKRPTTTVEEAEADREAEEIAELESQPQAQTFDDQGKPTNESEPSPEEQAAILAEEEAQQ